jgi:hypothetical protein
MDVDGLWLVLTSLSACVKLCRNYRNSVGPDKCELEIRTPSLCCED